MHEYSKICMNIYLNIQLFEYLFCEINIHNCLEYSRYWWIFMIFKWVWSPDVLPWHAELILIPVKFVLTTSDNLNAGLLLQEPAFFDPKNCGETPKSQKIGVIWGVWGVTPIYFWGYPRNLVFFWDTPQK